MIPDGGMERARVVLSLTYDQAEQWHRTELLSDIEWHRYRALWRHGAPRFSHVASDMDRPYSEERFTR